jgi:putative oxidoreductase
MRNRLLYLLVRTDASLGALAARLTLGICMLPHGLQKLQNFSMTMEKMGANVPKPLVFLVIMAESFGALGLILGVFSRFCAFGIGLVMIGAIWMVHGQWGFRLLDPVNPNPKEMGYEYNLALLGLSVAVMLAGSGAFSFDRWLTKRMQRTDAPVS